MVSRRKALKCMAAAGGGTLFILSGGVLTPMGVAAEPAAATPTGRPLFIQISDTHIGFNKDANPDVNGTLSETIAQINALKETPPLVLHTGDITHLSKPAEFETAQTLLSRLKARELHTVPGEHDVTDPGGAEYFRRFGAASGGKGWYSFDHGGVHFMALNNVMDAKGGGLGALGPEQLAWMRQDLAARTASTPIVVFAHMPLWSVYEPWGWGTADGAEVLLALRRFGSATVLNGHIHQIVQKVEGQITCHTARSTAFPQPVAGSAPAPGPLTVPAAELRHMLGVTEVSVVRHPRSLALTDTTLA
jgi:3',5'-cyclic AMP phosphodiesterase CpdA